MPVQKLKIDRSFITHVHEEPERMAIVRAVIAMAKSMDLLVIAEGVEAGPEARFLFDEGCDQGQGYFFSKPVGASELQVQCGAGIARLRDAVQSTSRDGADVALVDA